MSSTEYIILVTFDNDYFYEIVWTVNLYIWLEKTEPELDLNV